MNDPQLEVHMASHTERRKFLATLGGAAAAWPFAARAQHAGKVYRIGMLETVPAASNAANFDGKRKGLRELGYLRTRFCPSPASIDAFVKPEAYSSNLRTQTASLPRNERPFLPWLRERDHRTGRRCNAPGSRYLDRFPRMLQLFGGCSRRRAAARYGSPR